VETHPTVGVIATEHSRIVVLPLLERDHSGIEYGIGSRKEIPGNYRILGISPHDLVRAGGAVFPREIIIHQYVIVNH
jgi:hypothetical protein